MLFDLLQPVAFLRRERSFAVGLLEVVLLVDQFVDATDDRDVIHCRNPFACPLQTKAKVPEIGDAHAVARDTGIDMGKYDRTQCLTSLQSGPMPSRARGALGG